MKRISTKVAIFLLAFGLNCTKPGFIKCEAFSSAIFDQWIPYKNDATYNFSSGSNTESYSIYTVFRQKKEQQIKTANNRECPPWVHIEGSIGINGSFGIAALSNNGNASGDIAFRGIGFKFSSVRDTGFTIVPSVFIATTKFSSELIINGKTFNNVQQLVPQYNAESQGSLKAIYFQKGRGLIAYTYNDDTFVIQ